MEESGERVVDERLRAINKKTGKYVDLIKRTIDEVDNAIFTADLIINRLKTI